jgi:hypothetical protein
VQTAGVAVGMLPIVILCDVCTAPARAFPTTIQPGATASHKQSFATVGFGVCGAWVAPMEDLLPSSLSPAATPLSGVLEFGELFLWTRDGASLAPLARDPDAE